jgi:hypothetical protein
MKHTFKAIMAACASTLLIAACSTATDTQTADAKPDPRQGEEVRQVCFSQQIRNWRTVKEHRRAVIIQKGLNEEYKLDLIGTCQPDDAFVNIGLVSRMGGGTCLTTGDKLITDARYNDGDCSIQRIYAWNEKANTAAAN